MPRIVQLDEYLCHLSQLRFNRSLKELRGRPARGTRGELSTDIPHVAVGEGASNL